MSELPLAVERLPDAQTFLDVTGQYIGGREAEHNLLFGIAANLITDPDRSMTAPPYFAAVRRGGEVVAAALMTPPYNVVISNIPGPVESPLYWNRSRLLGMYPASIVLNGQALNISVTSYDHQLHFGLTGCRTTVPHLQRLLAHLETSLAELETL